MSNNSNTDIEIPFNNFACRVLVDCPGRCGENGTLYMCTYSGGKSVIYVICATPDTICIAFLHVSNHFEHML